MGTLVFQANLGGAVNLVGPNTASTVNFTLPSADGSSGQALVTNGSGTLSFSSFVSAAAGSNTQVQFNSSGAFAGSANLTFNGTTLTAANTSVTTSETLSYGTANGVAYLNGSKVVTTGSALTFDGSVFGVAPATGVVARTKQLVLNNFTGEGVGITFSRTSDDTEVNAIGTANSNWDMGLFARENILFAVGGGSTYSATTEAMRLTSTGLGIGTSSVLSKLVVSNAGAQGLEVQPGAITYLFAYNRNTSAYSPLDISGDYLRFSTGTGAERMRLDSSGNLGLGVTPSAWTAGGKNIEVGSAGNIVQGQASQIAVIQNATYNSGWKYSANGYASFALQTSGQHQWFTAPSGTAGNAISFTQAMTLDASGNLGIGTTSPTWMVSVRKDSAGGSSGQYPVVQINNANASGYAALYLNDSAAQAGLETRRDTAHLGFYAGGNERARIDSSGNFMLGTTSAINSGKFSILWNGTSVNAIELEESSGASGAGFVLFRNSSGTAIGSITRVTTTNAVVYNTTSDYRLKDIVGAVTGSGERIDALKPVDYTWKEDGSAARGFLAHEFKEVYANSVTGEKDAVDADGNPVYQSMQASTSEVIADLVAELQSLRKRVAQLEGAK